MDKFTVVLKNGFSFTTACENVTITYSTITGEACKLKYEGARKNIPIYIDVSQIAAVIQEEVCTDE